MRSQGDLVEESWMRRREIPMKLTAQEQLIAGANRANNQANNQIVGLTCPKQPHNLAVCCVDVWKPYIITKHRKLIHFFKIILKFIP